MLHLTLQFEGAWTNVFRGVDDRPLFTSGSALAATTRGLAAAAPEATPRPARGETRRLVRLRALQAANPGLGYRVPTGFDDTVRGVLARLVGEVRRLRTIRREAPDHLALRAFDAGDYELRVEHEHVRRATLAARRPALYPNGGAGATGPCPTYREARIGRRFFGHLGLDLSELVDVLAGGELPAGDWAPRSPGRLCDRLDALRDRQRRLTASAKALAKRGDASGLDRLARAWLALDPALDGRVSLAFAAAGDDRHPVEVAHASGWHLAGAVAVARAHRLDAPTREALVREGVLTSNGTLPGLTSPRAAIGRPVRKDIFRALRAPRHASDVRYGARLPLGSGDERTTAVETGLLVRSGTLAFRLDGPDALEAELDAAIRHAAVGPLSVGKKGVAWVRSLVRRPSTGP